VRAWQVDARAAAWNEKWGAATAAESTGSLGWSRLRRQTRYVETTSVEMPTGPPW
jgi:hypothetical protein